MTFRGVRIKNIDNKSPYIYPSRTIEIRMDDPIITPSRGATITEYNYKGKIPSEIPLDNTVSMSLTRLNLEKLDLFLHQNGVYARYMKKLSDNNDLMKYSPFRVQILQPTITSTKGKAPDGSWVETMSGTEYLTSNESKMQQFLRFIIKMQLDLIRNCIDPLFPFTI